MPSKLVRRDKNYHNSYQNHIFFQERTKSQNVIFLSEKISFGGAFYAKALKYDIKMHLQILENPLEPHIGFSKRAL